MSIQCPKCGREYDVTLFQFGRTIHCTCGARVGLEKRIVGEPLAAERPRTEPLMEEPLPEGALPAEPRFMVDAMLGALARWLRVLGYDTAYDPSIADQELVRRGLAEGRHILTRDRGIPQEWRVSSCTLLDSDNPEAQLKQVAEAFSLSADSGLFSRCTICNSRLATVSPDQVRDKVPPRVLELHEAFSWCPECGRVYWEGSHTRRMRKRLEEMLGS